MTLGPPDPRTADHGHLFVQLARPYVLPSHEGPHRTASMRPLVSLGMTVVFLASAVGITLASGKSHESQKYVAPLPPNYPASPTDPSDPATPMQDESSQLEPSASVDPSAVPLPVQLPQPSSSPTAYHPLPQVPPTTAAGVAGRAIASYESGKCLRAASVDGAPLQLWACDGSATQRWVVVADGTIRSNGLCLDAAGGSTGNGTIVQLTRCSGNAAQQFTLNAAADIVNRQADRCVDVRDHSTSNGTAIQLWDCGGQANQKWRLI